METYVSLVLVKKSPGRGGVLICLRTGKSKEWTGLSNEESKGIFGLPARLAEGEQQRLPLVLNTLFEQPYQSFQMFLIGPAWSHVHT